MVTTEKMGRRERKKLAQRESIHNETILLIEQGGVSSVTIDAICDAADIAKNTFYNYYSSKHELLLDICQVRLLDYLALAIEAAQKSAPTLAKQIDLVFKAIGQSGVVVGEVEKELILYMTSSLSQSFSDGASQIAFLNNALFSLFNAQKKELNPGLTPEFCAEITVGMLNALVLNWLHNADYDIDKKMKMLCKHIKSSMLR